MNNEELVAAYVRYWQAVGRWKDQGQWRRATNGTMEYYPTRQEIAAKCRLFRMRAGRQGAHARSPQGGKYAVATTAGI